MAKRRSGQGWLWPVLKYFGISSPAVLVAMILGYFNIKVPNTSQPSRENTNNSWDQFVKTAARDNAESTPPRADKPIPPPQEKLPPAPPVTVVTPNPPVKGSAPKNLGEVRTRLERMGASLRSHRDPQSGKYVLHATVPHPLDPQLFKVFQATDNNEWQGVTNTLLQVEEWHQRQRQNSLTNVRARKEILNAHNPDFIGPPCLKAAAKNTETTARRDGERRKLRDMLDSLLR